MAGAIVVITGPVGAGKTTVARLVVAQWGGAVAYLEGDVFWSFFAQRAPNATRQRDVKILVQALVASAARFARGGYDVVVDFTLGPWTWTPIQAALKELELDLVVLCPSEAVCADRAATRNAGAIDDYATYRELHAGFARLGTLESHAIRDDHAEPGELAARILTALAAGELRLARPR